MQKKERGEGTDGGEGKKDEESDDDIPDLVEGENFEGKVE
jgi:nascent polypeptide-associated complex subunit beta